MPRRSGLSLDGMKMCALSHMSFIILTALGVAASGWRALESPSSSRECNVNDLEYLADGPGFTLCYPKGLQVKTRTDADGSKDVWLTDLRDPRNFFGFKVTFRWRRLREGESVKDALEGLVAMLKLGQAKLDIVDVSRGKGAVAGLEGEAAVLRYTLNAGRVEYTDPDGKSKAAGDELIPIEVRVKAARVGGTLIASWCVTDTRRLAELAPISAGLEASARFTAP
jgi:hypothetical protein